MTRAMTANQGGTAATSGQRMRVEMEPVPEMPHVRKLVVRGRVTYLEAPELREAVLAEVESPDASIVLLELGGVEKMDTAGMAVLIEALLAGRDREVSMLLCSPSDSVMQIFRLAGFPELVASCCAGPEETRERLGG